VELGRLSVVNVLLARTAPQDPLAPLASRARLPYLRTRCRPRVRASHRGAGCGRSRPAGGAPTGLERRAERFIEDNAERAIRLADVASAAGVSPRTLQLAFRRFRDTTADYKARFHEAPSETLRRGAAGR
jgi:AraC-like DNA-binding protein